MAPSDESSHFIIIVILGLSLFKLCCKALVKATSYPNLPDARLLFSFMEPSTFSSSSVQA